MINDIKTLYDAIQRRRGGSSSSSIESLVTEIGNTIYEENTGLLDRVEAIEGNYVKMIDTTDTQYEALQEVEPDVVYNILPTE